MKLISVIVPVYKVEAYLDRCVQSIVDQTYKNLEIILVDDGSPDNCPAMCDAWATKDRRIRVIHKKNGGLSDARNAGMEIASGTFMGFIDSDDYIAPEMYQLLYDRIVADDSDLAACGVEMVWEDGTPPRPLTRTGQCVLNREEAMEAVIAESWLKQPVWYKLYKTELIRGIAFPIGKYHEDVFWSWQAVAKAQKVSVFDTPCYFYLQRSGSIMGEGYSLRRLDAIEAKRERLEFLEKEYPGLAAHSRTDLLFTCMYHGQLAMRHLEKEQKKLALESLRTVVYGLQLGKACRHLGLTHKCWARLAKLNFPLTCRVRNMLRIGV